MKPITEKKTKVQETLRLLNPGESVTFMTRDTRSITVRSAVSRLNKAEKLGLTCSEKGLINQIRVTKKIEQDADQ